MEKHQQQQQQTKEMLKRKKERIAKTSSPKDYFCFASVYTIAYLSTPLMLKSFIKY